MFEEGSSERCESERGRGGKEGGREGGREGRREGGREGEREGEREEERNGVKSGPTYCDDQSQYMYTYSMCPEILPISGLFNGRLFRRKQGTNRYFTDVEQPPNGDCPFRARSVFFLTVQCPYV